MSSNAPRSTAVIDTLSRGLSSRWISVVLGVTTACAILWVWGSIDQLAVFHDEAAYKLQAEIFSSGRWVAPSPPLPEFFEQYHVLVTPVLAAKYPPGHALILAIGSLLGLAGLMPLILSGCAGTLVFILSRQLANQWVGLLTWLVWLTSFDNLRWRATYFSEVTTSIIWLLVWWLLLKWRHDGQRRWLLLISALIGWGAITRPLTMLAFTIPAAVIILRTVHRQGSWRDILPALCIGMAFLCIIPFWSWRTTGSWMEPPHALYSRLYMPWDRLGFSIDDVTSAERPLPTDMTTFTKEFLELRKAHVLSALPAIMGDRFVMIADGMWGGWRSFLLPLALIGLVCSGHELKIAFVTAVILVLSHASYTHYSFWTVYYLEILPILAFLSALGLWNTFLFCERQITRWIIRVESAKSFVPHFSLFLFIAASPLAYDDLHQVQKYVGSFREYQHRFQALIKDIPEDKVGIFIRYSPRHIPHNSLIENTPDIKNAPAITAYDHGKDNVRLMKLMPERVWYLYDEERGSIFRL